MKIMQLNINHCEAAHDLLVQTTRELKIDLVLLSEPYKQLTGEPWETDTTAKAVIWSCGKFPLQNITGNGDAGFVAASVDGVRFYSCYAPPSISIAEFTDFLDRLVEDAKQHHPVAIAGDFNSWAVDWGSKHTNARGRALLEAFNELDIVLINNGDKPTYTKGGARSIIDLTFVSNSLARGNCKWNVLDIYTASDHHAILWEISKDQNSRRPITQSNVVGWKVKSFDPEALLIAFVSDPINTANAEEMTKNLMKRVTQACDASMPRKRGINSRPPVYWWNDDISILRKECHKKRRISQRGYRRTNSAELIEEYKMARRQLNKAIKESKKKCWEELIHEVDKDVRGRPYKMVMSHLKKQQMPPPTCPQLLRKIVTALFPQRSRFIHQLTSSELKDIPAVTEEELMEACNRIGNNKPPG
uniref:Putative r1-6 dk n=1 Tax=Xenopsylla cheopis TaxID=163159 RepID=A0A6M2DSR2_XENCH